MKKKLFDLSIPPNESARPPVQEVSKHDMAIIGISLRMPGADNIRDFWQLMQEGADCICKLPEARERDVRRLQQLANRSEAIEFGEAGYLTDIDAFDYDFFGISPKEAALMDPQQRLFLQVAWESLEQAGYGEARVRSSSTGVYVGFNSNHAGIYQQMVQHAEPEAVNIAFAGNMAPIIPSRIAHLLDLKGPAMLVDTACSSSLVAVHLACQAIRAGDCQMAIAGGVRVQLLPVKSGFKIGIESSDDRTKTFDERSDGTGWGEGVAAIVLKPYYKAKQDGDPIYAIIKGSAINQDGQSVGITAPNREAQEEVLMQAWRQAGIRPDTLGYWEAHGTGTKLGDPIEIDAIRNAVARFTDRKQYCAIATVKSNIGHLDSCAGIAGVIRAALALYYKQLPPMVHFQTPNRQINFTDSPVYVETVLQTWESTPDHPRRCGVSSFGLSGTNAHLVMEEAPQLQSASGVQQRTGFHLFTASARNQSQLRVLLRHYLEHLMADGSESSQCLGDWCYTVNTSRGHYAYRAAVVVDTLEQLKRVLEHMVLEGTDRVEQSDGIYYGDGGLATTQVHSSSANEVDDHMYDRSLAFDYSMCDEASLHVLAQRYVDGERLDWSAMYNNQMYRRLHLPVYPFAKLRCWINLGQDVNEGADNCDGADLPDLYVRAWIPCAPTSSEEDHIADSRLPGQTGTSLHAFSGRRVMLVHRGQVRAQQVKELLCSRGVRVTDLKLGTAFTALSKDEYVVRGTQHDYTEVLTQSGTDNEYITQVIFDMTPDNEDGDANVMNSRALFTQSLEWGVYTQFSWIKAYLTAGCSQLLDMLTIVSHAHLVTQEDRLVRPEYGPVIGFTKSIPLEYGHISTRIFDCDAFTTAEEIAAELANRFETAVVAQRNSKRYREQIQTLVSWNDVNTASEGSAELRSPAIRVETDFSCANGRQLESDATAASYQQFDSNQILKSDGVYVMTGGTGGIGLTLARHIASQHHISIALIGRNIPSQLLQRNDAAEVYLTDDASYPPKLLDKLRTAAQDIESLGSQVYFYSVDVCDEAAVSALMARLRSKFGRINGIVHSAGVPGEGFIIRKDMEVFRNVLAPKVQGTWNLEHATAADELDFFILCSSMTSAFGGAGQSDYAAANAFLDHFAAYRSQTGSSRTISIQWPTWRETGMAVERGINMNHTWFKPISNRQACMILDHVLAGGPPVVMAGEWQPSALHGSTALTAALPLSPDIHQRLQAAVASSQKQDATPARQFKPVVVKGESISEMAAYIAQVWREVLGFEEFHAEANFFDIGGDSIMIVSVHRLLEERYTGVTTMVDLFMHPTIQSLSMFIDKRLQEIDVKDCMEQQVEKQKSDTRIGAGQNTDVSSLDQAEYEAELLALFDQVEQGKLSQGEAYRQLDRREEKRQ
ncbi:SDR family NAD(P)-dependent oxidoreductase [Paenibacillus sp. ACRRX]|uniref:type I polyketide synthase n=1 Tax=Paenibacillus sp. ACRRX TaxID=2918206 RepID=UPI001EF46DC6|nr:type I polyketide synthase [Paenibacillus sp. ACRRX]MCG7406876.1 SDR family NAD(P)-dependent oxidoreductase [Paenibacillus sp. ACRRX]